MFTKSAKTVCALISCCLGETSASGFCIMKRLRVLVFLLDGMLVHGKVPPSIKEARSRYFRYFSQLWVLKVKLAEQWCFICKFTQQMRMILKLCKWNFDVNWNKLALTWSRADVFQVYPNVIHFNPLRFCPSVSVLDFPVFVWVLL